MPALEALYAGFNYCLLTTPIVFVNKSTTKQGEAVLNEKVGFKIPTTRYRKNSILCGALHIGTAKWTSGVRWSFVAS